jgi:hypothetical protein
VASPDGPASALGLHRIPPSGRFFGLDFTHFLAGDSAVIAPIIRLLFPAKHLISLEKYFS